MIRLRNLLLLCLMLIPVSLQALTPEPAGKQDTPIAITGVVAHIGNQTVITNATITFDEGKLTAVTGDTNLDLSGHEIVPMTGKHVYPGFILPNTDVGLVEVNAVRASVDSKERGSQNPSVRALVAYNTDSEIIPTLRFNGILTAQVTPKGSLIAGTSSVVQLDAWNWEDAAVSADDGLHLYWPARFKRKVNYARGLLTMVENDKYESTVQQLQPLFDNASVYDPDQGINLKLAAVKRILDGQGALYIHANGAREIIAAIDFARNYKVPNVVLVGGAEALLVKDLLLEENIPVISNAVHSLPKSPDDDIDMPYKRAAALHAAGVKVGLASNTRQEPAGGRNLPFMAGTVAAYGMDKEAAVEMITRTNAEILGVDDRLGTLEVGKDATLFISDGDALDMRTNQVVKAYIQGRELNLDGTQQQLFDRFQRKYDAE